MKTEKQCYTVSPRNIQAAQKSSRVNFTDNRPQAIAQAKMINAIRSKTIQRQVCLLKPTFTDDFVENVSIDYALKRAGGPVQAFPASDFSAIPAGGNLYFVAHGAVGRAGDYSTTEIAKSLMDVITGLRHRDINITFTCCYAGKDNTTGVNTSVIDDLKRKLNSPNNSLTTPYTGSITGAKGPSIKSNETGNDFFVVGAQPASALASVINIQRKVESDFITSTLKPNSNTYINDANSKLESTNKMSSTLVNSLDTLIKATSKTALNGLIEDILLELSKNGHTLTSAEKIAFITAFTSGFYTQFKNALQTPAPIPPATATPGSFLLPPGSAMKTV